MTGMASVGEITHLLREVEAGREGARDKLWAAVYADLERMAHSYLHRHFGDQAEAITLQPADLVNESLLKLIQQRTKYREAQERRDTLKTKQQTSQVQRSAAREEKRLQTELEQVERDDRQRRCTKAHEEIQSLDHHMPVYFVDETGNRVFLDEKKRADLIEFYRGEIEMFCD